jgi:NAD(P)H dehydrogenase (quinone)
MFAITGITGQVGGSVARHLLDAKQPVRAVVRERSKADAWAKRRCEIAVADVKDVAALTAAFKGAEAVFLLAPPNFDPSPDFREARTVIANFRSALEAARPARVVYLSTVGAQAKQDNLLTQHSIAEQMLKELSMPVTFLRPAWFIENFSWDVTSAREKGVISSFLQPLDKPVPMVGTDDIGRFAAELLQERWTGHRVVELEGPRRVTPNEIASTFSKLLGKPVKAEAVLRDSWEKLFLSQGMKNPNPRIRMLDGFNEGWIDFETSETGTLKGKLSLEAVLKGLIR